jgi:glycosyltransferase involved in cell wall biosynthesis
MTDRRLHVHALIDSLGWGGAELLLGDFATAAPGVGIDLSVGFLSDRNGSPAADRLRRSGVDPIHVRVTGLIHPRDLGAVRRHLSDLRPDVLHTHLGYSDFLGGIAARSLGIPAVSTVHVMGWDRGELRNHAKVALISHVRRRYMKRVVAVSEPARQWLLDNRWARHDQLVTVRNGAVAIARPGTGIRIRAELGFGREHLVVGMLSVLRPEKGHDLAARAVALLRERFPSLRLIVVGDGPSRTEVARALAPLGDAAAMTGHREDVMEVLDAFDVLLHPSRIDAFPTSLLQAMAAGVPVVASRIGGIPEAVLPGETGLLVDSPPTPDDVATALASLLADPVIRRGMGQRAREHFQNEFTAERWAGRMRELYEEIRPPLQ